MHLVQGSSHDFPIKESSLVQKGVDDVGAQCPILFVHLLKCGMKSGVEY